MSEKNELQHQDDNLKHWGIKGMSWKHKKKKNDEDLKDRLRSLIKNAKSKAGKSAKKAKTAVVKTEHKVEVKVNKSVKSVKTKVKKIKKDKANRSKMKSFLKKVDGIKKDVKSKNREKIDHKNVRIGGEPISKVRAKIKSNNRAATNPSGAELDRIKKLSKKEKQKRLKELWKDVPNADLKDKMKFQGNLFPKKKHRK